MKKEYGVVFELTKKWIDTYLYAIPFTYKGETYMYCDCFYTTEDGLIACKVEDIVLIKDLNDYLLDCPEVVDKFLNYVDEQISLITFRKDLLNYIKNIN